ncbi:MAG: hypothetical protein R3C28_02150 [Pirellulaceae bacterium]
MKWTWTLLPAISFGTSITDSFLSLPTLAINLDTEDLFAADRGIYANPTDDGRDWERIASVELLHPSGRTALQVDGNTDSRWCESRTNQYAEAFVSTLSRGIWRKDVGGTVVRIRRGDSI